MNYTIWGMIHVPALPGSINNTLSMSDIEEFCLQDAKILSDNGINNLIIENYGDTPFSKSQVQPHIISSLTRITSLIQSHYPKIQIGINVLRNDAISALGIASICNCTLIRVNILTYARLTDQGIIEGTAFELKQYQQLLQSKVEIWADVEVKHSVVLTPVPIQSVISDTLKRAGASKIIITGTETGKPADIGVIEKLIENQLVKPDQVVIGSGITPESLSSFLQYATNFIVGTSLKQNGLIENAVDPKRVQKLIDVLP